MIRIVIPPPLSKDALDALRDRRKADADVQAMYGEVERLAKLYSEAVMLLDELYERRLGKAVNQIISDLMERHQVPGWKRT